MLDWAWDKTAGRNGHTFVTPSPSQSQRAMASYKLNRMASTIRKMENVLPKSLHPLGYTFVFNNMVKLAGTAGLRVAKLTGREVEVDLSLGKLRASPRWLCWALPLDRVAGQRSDTLSDIFCVEALGGD